MTDLAAIAAALTDAANEVVIDALTRQKCAPQTETKADQAFDYAIAGSLLAVAEVLRKLSHGPDQI